MNPNDLRSSAPALHPTRLAGCFLAAVLATTASGQAAQRRAAVPHGPADLPLTGLLYRAQLDANRGMGAAELGALYRPQGLRVDPDGRVQVELIGPAGSPLDVDALVAAEGGEVTTAWRNGADALVPAVRLAALAARLPEGVLLRRAHAPLPDDVVGEGPAMANSAAWRNGGGDGSGLTIAVIDRGFAGFAASQANGDLPATVGAVSYVSGSAWNAGSGTHGTSCVEVIYDHAPGATYRVYRIDSVVDLGAAVSNCIVNGVDIISMSQSFYNQGWDDDDGLACAAAKAASDAGILFFTSAGNRAGQHWQGAFNAGLGTSWLHDWVNGTEGLQITFPSDGTGEFTLAWDRSQGATDYDLYLYDDVGLTQLLASSVSNGPGIYEDLTWTNFTPGNKVVYLVVDRWSGPETDIEVFLHSGGLSICDPGAGGFPANAVTPSNSCTSPSNSTAPLVLSVGAVDEDVYASPAGSSPLICYSGQGPTNWGNQAPDLCGPTNVQTFVDSGSFGGTSCATPNAAGVAACLWSDNVALDASGVAHLLMRQARLFRDWGSPAHDMMHGAGGAYLVDFAPNTLFVDKVYGNINDAVTGPYYHVQAAHDAASSGGRLVFPFGGDYIESVSMSKTLELLPLGSDLHIEP